MPVFEMVKSLGPGQLEAVRKLYVSEGWWYEADLEDEGRLGRIVAGSLFFCLALEGGDVVGMGRALGDGVSDAYIQDVAVRADYRKKGIATKILKHLVGALTESGHTWIGLIATPQSHNLYRRFGFEELEGNTPMRLRQSED